jgi:hypothetical protein
MLLLSAKIIEPATSHATTIRGLKLTGAAQNTKTMLLCASCLQVSVRQPTSPSALQYAGSGVQSQLHITFHQGQLQPGFSSQVLQQLDEARLLIQSTNKSADIDKQTEATYIKDKQQQQQQQQKGKLCR